jgi:hypothetical protein
MVDRPRAGVASGRRSVNAQPPKRPAMLAVPEAYGTRIAGHLTHIVDDPWHHLLAIEWLARAARAEWWEARRSAKRRREPAP